MGHQDAYNDAYNAGKASMLKPSQPHKVRFWQVEEATGGGNYIVLPGIHMNKGNAERAFPKGRGFFRAAEYQQGHGINGPERVEP